MGGLADAIESNLGKVVGTAAPLLAAALATPLAGVLVSVLASAFGVGSGKAADVASAILADPDSASKLAALELEHQESLAKIASSDYAAEISDRIDARTHAQDYKKFIVIMAIMVTAGFFGALFMLFVPIEITELQRTLLSMLVGMLASKWQTIIDFFYGSSHIHTTTEGVTPHGRSTS